MSTQPKPTFAVLPLIRKVKSEEWPIFLRITVNGKPLEISVRHSVEPAQWNKAKGRVRGFSEKAKLINQTIEMLEGKARQHYNRLVDQGKIITAQVIKNAVLGITQQQYTLLHLFEQHTTEIATLVGMDFAKGTHQNYLSTAKHLREYLKYQYQSEDIYLNQLDFAFINGLELYLKTKCENSQNGAAKHIQRLRKVVNLAIKRDFLEKDPFSSYHIKKAKTTRHYLTEEELQRIAGKVIPVKRTRVTRDMFLFACYTGLAYKDVQSLTRENLRKGIDGEWWIFTSRSKTNIASNIPLLPPALQIIERYREHPLASSRGTLLPIYSNQRLNTYLKEIADMCDIPKNLSFHIARHTFATTVTLSNDIPIETVSKMLGHGSLRTTQIYAKVIERKVSKDMGKLRDKYKDGTDNQGAEKLA